MSGDGPRSHSKLSPQNAQISLEPTVRSESRLCSRLQPVIWLAQKAAVGQEQTLNSVRSPAPNWPCLGQWLYCST